MPEERVVRDREVKEYHAAYQRNRRLKEAKRRSKDKIQCHICKLWYRQVSNHVWAIHKICSREYRRQLGLDIKRGLLPQDLRKRKAKHVFENGTIENLKRGRKFWFKKGDASVGRYQRSLQTLERLKNQVMRIHCVK
jgi:hypothetical protein